MLDLHLHLNLVFRLFNEGGGTDLGLPSLPQRSPSKPVRPLSFALIYLQLFEKCLFFFPSSALRFYFFISFHLGKVKGFLYSEHAERTVPRSQLLEIRHLGSYGVIAPLQGI